MAKRRRAPGASCGVLCGCACVRGGAGWGKTRTWQGGARENRSEEKGAEEYRAGGGCAAGGKREMESSAGLLAALGRCERDEGRARERFRVRKGVGVDGPAGPRGSRPAWLLAPFPSKFFPL